MSTSKSTIVPFRGRSCRAGYTLAASVAMIDMEMEKVEKPGRGETGGKAETN